MDTLEIKVYEAAEAFEGGEHYDGVVAGSEIANAIIKLRDMYEDMEYENWNGN